MVHWGTHETEKSHLERALIIEEAYYGPALKIEVAKTQENQKQELVIKWGSWNSKNLLGARPEN